MRIFRSCAVGHECFFKCWAIELVSERCIVSLLDRVVEVKPTYMLLLSEIQSPKGHLNLYITLVFCKTPIEGEELFLMSRFEVLKYISKYIYIYIYIYIYMYSSYRTITDVFTTSLLPKKPSSDDDSRFRHGFGAEASLPLAQSAPVVSHDTTCLSDCCHFMGLPYPCRCS